ncbi:chorismate mutase [Pseudomonas sp. NPDC089554]|uniref:chorismate mutase n=1 Tax=Pseudomonas sp. NPDC089554 TaxID=3390653 RepID=UPI003D082B00
MSLRHTLALPLLIGLFGCTTNASASPLDDLLDAVEQRLRLAEAVALHKWDQRSPVHAPERERQVLERVAEEAPQHGLTPERAQAFFGDQIESNKFVQYSLLNTWHYRGEAPDTERKDLETEIRPELDALQERLLSDLSQFDQHALPDCHKQLAIALSARPGDALLQHAMVRATGQLCPLP